MTTTLQFSPNFDTSLNLWEELSQKIPELLLTGIFTLECDFTIDGLGRLKVKKNKRGAYSISPNVKTALNNNTRRVFSPLLAKYMDLLPSISVENLKEEKHEEQLNPEDLMNIKHGDSIEADRIISKITETWDEINENYNVILPNLGITFYCVERHIITKEIKHSTHDCKTIVHLSTRIQSVSEQFSPFYLEKEFSFPKTEYQLHVPEELKINTILNNPDTKIQIVLTPEATLELLYLIYQNNNESMVPTGENKLTVEPFNENAFINSKIDDMSISREVTNISEKEHHPHLNAKILANPLNDASYPLKPYPTHVSWDGEKFESPTDAIVVEKINLNSEYKFTPNFIFITGYNSYLMKEGEFIAFIPKLSFVMPNFKNNITNFKAISDVIWVSPSYLPISAEIPFFSLKNSRIIHS